MQVKLHFFVIRETLLDQAALRKVGGPFVLFSLNVKPRDQGEDSTKATVQKYC
jgi:hypothetical protein